MKKILLMLSLLFFTTAGFSEVSDTLVTGGYDKQAMSDAIKHAISKGKNQVGILQ